MAISLAYSGTCACIYYNNKRLKIRRATELILNKRRSIVDLGYDVCEPDQKAKTIT